jgi:hypothetical protein
VLTYWLIGFKLPFVVLDPRKQGISLRPENRMQRRLLPIVFLLILPYPLKGQDLQSAQHQAATPLSTARFEIIQAGPGAQWTLKLDRITGNVQRLVSGKAGNLVWEKMRVLPHPKAVNSAEPHFQIFVSSRADQVTLLLDTGSGASWQLIPKDDGGLWQPIE